MNTAQKFIETHNTMTIATVGKDSAAAAAVFYAPVKKNTALIFVSNENSEHIVNSNETPRCAATIQEDGLEWSKIKGLQVKGTIALAKEKYWKHYFKKYPYIKTDKTLSKALEKVKLYEFKIKWARLIDNSEGFGNRKEYKF